MTTDVPVLIVGGGPAGLTASLLLSQHGVETLLVDKRLPSSGLPRARGYHSRAMEIMRVGGVEPALRAQELLVDPGAQWRPRLTSPPIREDAGVTPGAVDHSPCAGLALAQDVFEAILREHACAYDLAEVRAAVEVESLEVVNDGVGAVLHERASDVRHRVRARFVIAADGARSSIREQLGIAMQGDADLGGQRMVAFRANLAEWTAPRPRAIYYLTDVVAALIWTHPDDRWVLNVREPSPDLDPQALVRLALGVPDLPLEILGEHRWTATAESATRYGDGRIFLVGDAAHRVPPVGATGVSTAIHDAHNLAWKLAAVLKSRAGGALLDSYRVERGAVGARNVAETGAAWSQLFRRLGAPFLGRSLQQIDMGYQYRSAVVIPDDGPDMDLPGAHYTPTAAPGCRAPHLWLDHNQERSTIDLFHREFVLLSAPPGEAWRTAVGTVSERLEVPLASHVIASRGWPDLYGITATGAVLVRPDGHVAWRAAGLPTDGADTERQLATSVALAHGLESGPFPG